MNKEEDHILFQKIGQSDKKAFETLFRRYYPNLCLYASQMLKNRSEAEEIVQSLFVRLWEKRKVTNIDSSVKSYLFRAVKNLCLNQIKHDQVKSEYSLNYLKEKETTALEDDFLAREELLRKIEESLESLPEKRREIFRLSREEGLKYKEIAERLNISVKTVETQMGLAIKNLKEKLKNFLLIF